MRIGLILVVLFAALSVGCAGLKPGMEKPRVKVVSLTPVAADGFQQRFAVGLMVTNPNAEDIALRGMSYDIGIAGHDIFSGVAGQLPVLKAYTETPVTVEVSANLMSVLALISDLANRKPEELDYKLAAKLDVGAMLPAIRVEEAGPLPFFKPAQLRAKPR